MWRRAADEHDLESASVFRLLQMVLQHASIHRSTASASSHTVTARQPADHTWKATVDDLVADCSMTRWALQAGHNHVACHRNVQCAATHVPIAWPQTSQESRLECQTSLFRHGPLDSIIVFLFFFEAMQQSLHCNFSLSLSLAQLAHAALGSVGITWLKKQPLGYAHMHDTDGSRTVVTL